MVAKFHKEFGQEEASCPVSRGKHELGFDLTLFRDEPANTEWMLEYNMTSKFSPPGQPEFLIIRLYFFLLDSPEP
ncbi:hypothetical protein FRC07_003086 [Ceratobasidium sp. 392]|nr:hypothetical protein FRC07_003086 [Ceratobasidium sp. 392]